MNGGSGGGLYGGNDRKSEDAQRGYVRRQLPRACLQGFNGWCRDAFARIYAIWYVVSGSCTHIVEGAEYPLRAKNIFVIPPFVEHGLKDERDNFTIICCEFPAELITGDNLFDPAGRGLLRYTCIESFAAVLSRTRSLPYAGRTEPGDA